MKMKDVAEWALVAAVVMAYWLLALAMVPPAHAGPIHVWACMSPNGEFGWHMTGRIAPPTILDRIEDAGRRLIGITEDEESPAPARDLGCDSLFAELMALDGGAGEDGS